LGISAETVAKPWRDELRALSGWFSYDEVGLGSVFVGTLFR
jgi:hypothetical protein